MHSSTVVSTLAIGAGVVSATLYSGRSLKHVRKADKHPRLDKELSDAAFSAFHFAVLDKIKYSVNGTAIPEVAFDIGESYAGLMPISKTGNDSQLYFWFFPSENPAASDDFLIWLNGGPGCSSLEGLLQENGPFLWQYGTYKPVPNPWTWVNLTNVVWVKHPVGIRFSQGIPTATSETDVANQFLGFWENFAGHYVPYIADAMLNKNNTMYHNLEATMIYDSSTSCKAVQEQIPAVQFVDYWKGLMPFNDSFSAQLHKMSDSCGYTDYLRTYFTLPPPGPFPTQLPGTDEDENTFDNCHVFDAIYNEVAATCPVLWDVLGFSGSFGNLPEGTSIYFNRTDVQKAISAPIGNWNE